MDSQKAMNIILEKLRMQIEKSNNNTIKRTNKGLKRVTFAPGDWLWDHFMKERSPIKMKNMFIPTRDEPFKLLENIGYNYMLKFTSR